MGRLFCFALVLVAVCAASAASLLPPRLQAGDTVMFVSPCSPPCYIVEDCPDGFKASVEKHMSALGLNTVWGTFAFEQDQYLAGTDEQRAADLQAAFEDPTIKAIIATRGGEGSSRMLHLLNYSAFAPKIVMGYSDMTAVINAVHSQTNLVTFHGPMGISDSTNWPFFKRIAMDAVPLVLTTPLHMNPYTIRPGVAKGKLIGGNLSILTNILGSKYAVLDAFRGAILFIEDVDEVPYKIDRYMTQLALFGVLDVVAGVVFGQCTNCVAPPPTFTIPEVLKHHLASRPYPSFAGAFFGHIDTQYTLPLGLVAEINANNYTIAFGPAVQ